MPLAPSPFCENVVAVVVVVVVVVVLLLCACVCVAFSYAVPCVQRSCSGCPSSSQTLKSGIERTLKHYVPEVCLLVFLHTPLLAMAFHHILILLLILLLLLRASSSAASASLLLACFASLLSPSSCIFPCSRSIFFDTSRNENARRSRT